MKRFLLAMALVLVMAIPAFAEDWVGPINSEAQNDSPRVLANFGPVKMKLLMADTRDATDVPTPYFSIGETIRSHTNWEVKGTGSFTVKFQVLDSAGVLIDKKKYGPYEINSSTFNAWGTDVTSNSAVAAGYYTVKTIYVDVATGNSWIHQTKVHVLAP